MYRYHYSLNKKPFQLTTDPKFLWLGEKHKEALATLKYGVIDQKGFLLVTGDVGTGKTTLINALIQSLRNDILAVTIYDPSLQVLEFFNIISNAFNMKRNFHGKGEFLIYFKKFLNQIRVQNKKVLMIIDEAQRISNELLEEVRLLSRLEGEYIRLLNIFFVGQNEFIDILKEYENRTFRQRINLVYQIEPLSETETLAYIKHRLKIAGTEKSIFTQEAIREIYNFSKGYPRLINIICDDALLTGYARNLKKITPDVIMECAKQFNSIGETLNNNPLISHEQHQSVCQFHSVTCPFLKDIADKAPSSEKRETKVFILPQTEISREQIAPQEQTRNNDVDGSEASTARRLRKRIFSWTSVLSFITRIQKRVFSQAAAANPLIKRMQKKLLFWVSAALPFLKRMQKKLLFWVSVALPFLKRMQKKLSSRVSLASLPTLLQNKRLFWTSIVSFALIVMVIVGFYQKALTIKNNLPKPASLALKTTPSSPNAPKEHLTSHGSQIKGAEITLGHKIKAISPEKTKISKPNVLEQAKTALQNKNFNRAIELFEQVIAQHPENAPEIKTYYSKALQGQADIILIKNPNTAQMLLSKAIGADPENAKAHFDLGSLYLKSKNYPKAIKAYQEAANLNHRPSDAVYNLGFIYASTEDFANAEKMFLHVVDLKPPYIDKALFNLAVVQQKQGKQKECIENLEKAIINNPKNQRVQQYLNQLKNYKGVS